MHFLGREDLVGFCASPVVAARATPVRQAPSQVDFTKSAKKSAEKIRPDLLQMWGINKERVCQSGEQNVLFLQGIASGIANSRERQRGRQTAGGAQNLTTRPPMVNSFRPPSPGSVPPPNGISLMKSLINSQSFPQVTPSKTVFVGSPKMVSKAPSPRGFAPRCFAPRLARPRNSSLENAQNLKEQSVEGGA